jgi:DHA2 family methylenomycin A resistance protein-like MFS transporter
MLPRRLATHPTFVAANVVGLIMNFGGTAVILLLTLLVQVARHHSPLATAWWLVPVTAPMAVVAPLAGRIAARSGSRIPMAIGMTTAALGMIVFATVSATGPMTATVVASVLIGTGLALNTAPMVAAVMASVQADERGLAGAVNNTARQVGAAIGVAALGAVAGDPVSHGFVAGLHRGAIVAALLWLGAAVLAFIAVDRSEPSSRLTQAPASAGDPAPRPGTDGALAVDPGLSVGSSELLVSRFGGDDVERRL